MKSIAEHLHESATRRANSETAEWCSERYRIVRGYFEGDISLGMLRQSIHGYDGLRLVSLTSPHTEEWSLLMSAFDILLEEDGVKETEAGWMTAAEYVDLVASSRKTGKYAAVAKRTERRYDW